MTVRTAGPADAADVVALEDACLGADAWPAGLVESGVAGETPTVTFLVAEVDGVVVGHAALSVVPDVAELQRIAVTPTRQRSGLGSALLEAAVERARADGAERLLLEVREDNDAATGLYARRGFVEIDRRRRYYRDGAAAIVMQLALGPPTP